MNWFANHIRWYKIIHYHISTNFTLSSGVRKCQKQFKPEWKTHWGNLYFRQHRPYVRGLLIAFLEGLMLKLKLQHFGHLMRRADSLEKTLMMGKIEGRRRRGWQRMWWLDGITDSMDMNLSKLAAGDEQGGLACCSLWGCKELDTTEWLNRTENWTKFLANPMFGFIDQKVPFW